MTPISRRYFRDAGPVRKTRVNHEIRLTPIRLVDQNNQQVGEIETREALRMAEEAGLDLVEIQPDVRPPLCKIMDYGKYKYELSKKQKGNTARKANEIKEVRLGRSAKIDPHDVEIRVKQARRFLMEGHKVQLVQQFRGREMAHKEIGMNRLQQICVDLADIAKVESPPKHLGRRVMVMLAPDRQKIEILKRKAENERKRAEKEKEKEKAALAAADPNALAADPAPKKVEEPREKVAAEQPEGAESVTSER